MLVFDFCSLNVFFFGRWVVENQIGRKNLVIDDCDAKQSVYVYGCKDSVLKIQGTSLLSYKQYVIFVLQLIFILNCLP